MSEPILAIVTRKESETNDKIVTYIMIETKYPLVTLNQIEAI